MFTKNANELHCIYSYFPRETFWIYGYKKCSKHLNRLCFHFFKRVCGFLLIELFASVKFAYAVKYFIKEIYCLQMFVKCHHRNYFFLHLRFTTKTYLRNLFLLFSRTFNQIKTFKNIILFSFLRYWHLHNYSICQ